MLAVEMNPKTKLLSLVPATVEDLDEEEMKEAQRTVDLVNRLVHDFVATDDKFPKTTGINAKITQTSQQLIKNGIAAIQNKNYNEAIKLLTTALETVLRRPLWESIATVLDEVCACLGARCDAFCQANMWPEAYADATTLTLIKPNDPAHLYRRAITLLAIERYDLARDVVETGLSMKANEPLFKTLMEKINQVLQPPKLTHAADKDKK